PEIPLAAQVGTHLHLIAVGALAEARPGVAGDGAAVRDVYIEERLWRQPLREDGVAHGVRETSRRLEPGLGPALERNREGRDAADGAFDSGSDGAAVKKISAQVEAAIDAAGDERRAARQDVEDAEVDAVGRRAVHRPPAGLALLDA